MVGTQVFHDCVPEQNSGLQKVVLDLDLNPAESPAVPSQHACPGAALTETEPRPGPGPGPGTGPEFEPGSAPDRNPERRPFSDYNIQLQTRDDVTSDYQNDFREVMTSGSDDYIEVKRWLKGTLENLDSRGLKEFQWYLVNADESKDGFNPIPLCRLEHANRLDTIDLMSQRFSSKTREVAETVLKKLQTEKSLPELVFQDDPVFPAGATERTVRMMSDFVKKVSIQTLTELLEALLTDGVLDERDKKSILEENHTRVNKASCLVDIVMQKDEEVCNKMINHLQTINPSLSSELDVSGGPSAAGLEPKPKPKSEAGPGLRSAPDPNPEQRPFSDHNIQPQTHDDVTSEDQDDFTEVMTSGSDDYIEVKRWLKGTLENLDSRGLKLFQWYLVNADESKDGFKPIPLCRLEHADRLDTVDLMSERFSSKTREVAEMVLKKLQSDKEKHVIQDDPFSPAGATERNVSMLSDFVKKVSKETLTELLEALVTDGVLDDRDKKSILEENHTRVNKASCLVYIVTQKDEEVCIKMINHLQTINPLLSSELDVSAGLFAASEFTSF
ncbi:uncharacterized protein LOC133425141 [Cololabis saira]|uniref:uncharacterized protein LOC133425141 n=1 Tax=Cololabis saira TaxID=129043 RepID=UPI002AD4EECA|nr:uncharacterized protein LOC133425141 [Cololabis saira]